MKRAKGAVWSVAKDLGLEGSLKLYLIGAKWETIFSTPLSLHTFPVRLTGGQLLIHVDTSAWLQEITFHKTEMLRKLRDFGVMDIRCKLGRVKTQPSEPFRHSEAIPESRRRFIEEVVSGLVDEELIASVRRAMETWASKGRGALSPPMPEPGASAKDN